MTNEQARQIAEEILDNCFEGGCREDRIESLCITVLRVAHEEWNAAIEKCVAVADNYDLGVHRATYMQNGSTIHHNETEADRTARKITNDIRPSRAR